MNEIITLSAKHYENAETTNYGDCILINTGTELYIYDCGSSKHAEEVIQLLLGTKFGFTFDLTKSELIFYNNIHLGDIITRLNNAFTKIN